MSSKIGVQNIAHTNGTVAATVSSGGNVAMASGKTLSATGHVLQVKHFHIGTVNNTSTVVPNDNTIPQSNEGKEFMTLAITPKSASSKLLIQVHLMGSANDTGRQVTVGLFQDSIANALAATGMYESVGTGIMNLSFNHYKTAGTTSEITFKVRAGSHSGIFTLNGYSTTTPTMGGVGVSSINIMEIGG